jgi:molecular chaperone DnaK
MAKVIGIDLGTTNSCVAVMEGGKPKVVENAEGARTTPSIVAFAKDGERLIGQPAKRQAVTNPDNTVFAVKRLIGRRFDDPITKKDTELVPVQDRARPERRCVGHAGGKDYSPVADLRLHAAEDEGNRRGLSRRDGHPGGDHRSRLLQRRAAPGDQGCRPDCRPEVLRIINEPTAAALAYGLEKQDGKTIAVYDLGGGTFDISILEIGDGVFEVKATNGDTFLGGEDFDSKIVEYLADTFKKSEGIDLRGDRLALQRLKEAAEKAKIELSSAQTTEVNLPFITADATGPKHLVKSISRADLERLVEELIKRTLEPCRKAIKDAGVDAKDIAEVVLVGGMTRMPRVRQVVQDFFGKEPHTGVNPDEVVAMGAAIQAGVLQGDVKDVLLLDVTPLSLGIETLGGVFTRMIDRNTTIRPRSRRPIRPRGQSECGDDPRLPGRARDGGGQQDARPVRSGRHPPAPRGVPQIEVTFDIDANGIVNVSARDKGTGKEQQIRIQARAACRRRHRQDGARRGAFAEEDKKRRAAAESRNKADSLVHTTEMQLREHGDKIDAGLKSEIETAIVETRGAIESNDPDQMEAKSQALAKWL